MFLCIFYVEVEFVSLKSKRNVSIIIFFFIFILNINIFLVNYRDVDDIKVWILEKDIAFFILDYGRDLVSV